MKDGYACEDCRDGGGNEGENCCDGLGERDFRLIERQKKVPFGKVVRTNRLAEFGLLNTVFFAGGSAAFAFAWGLLGGKRVKFRWIAASAAGIVTTFWALGCFLTGYAWLMW